MEEQRMMDGGGGAPAAGSSHREIRVVADAAELTRAAAEEVTATLAGQRAAAAARVAAAPAFAAAAAAAAAASAAAAAAAAATAASAAAAAAAAAAPAAAAPLVAAAPAATRAPFPSFVLAGGSTPRALYRLLADEDAAFRERIDWPAIHFFWGDERHVPPDHPDSNFRMAREAMLERVPVPAAHVHRIAGEEPDAARAARRYERELIDLFGVAAGDGERETALASAPRPDGPRVDQGRDRAPVDQARGDQGLDQARDDPRLDQARGWPRLDQARGWPRFDLVLLGLGEEGHTASLFPGSPLLAGWPAARPSRQLAAAVWVEKLATWRITLTPAALNHAATVIFLVSGAAKAAALAAVLEGPRQPELVPAQVVAPSDGRVLWLVDRAAAAQLRSLS